MKFNYIILALLFAVSIYGQEAARDFRYGVKAGLNLALVPEVLEEVKENHSKPRLNFGVMGSWRLSDKFHINGEMNYSLKGTDAVFILTDEIFTEGIDINADFNLDYLEFPIIIRWNFYDKFYLGAGTYWSFLLKNKVHVYTTKEVEEEIGFGVDAEGDFQDVLEQLRLQGREYDVKLNKTDFGVLLEAGYLFDFGLDLNVRYTQGLQKIIDGPDFNVSPKNQVFFFGAGYFF